MTQQTLTIPPHLLKRSVAVPCPYCHTEKRPYYKATQMLETDESVRYPTVEREMANEAKLDGPVQDLRQGSRKCARCRERFWVVYSLAANRIRGYRRGQLPSSLHMPTRVFAPQKEAIRP
jgi:hypothetical protein